MGKYKGNGLGGPFSEQVPWLRIAWDATALDALMRDPFGYVFEMNGGWRSREPAPPLTFGDLYGRVRQMYDVRRSEGAEREAVVDECLRYANKLAIEHDLEYVKTFGARADIEKRSTASLMRSIIWHDEMFGGFDPVKPVAGMDGKALMEQNFVVPLPFCAHTGEQYKLCGYLDGVVSYMGDTMPREMKHTVHELSDFYFAGYETSTQIRCYLLVAWLHFTNGEGFQSDLLLDATSFGTSPGKKGTAAKPATAKREAVAAVPDKPAIPYVNFKRKVMSAPRSLLDEWISNLEYWLRHVAERDRGLGLHQPTFSTFRPWSPPGQSLFTRKDGQGGSAFKRGMLTDPVMREAWVRERFEQREPWNPTIEREKF